MNTLDTALLVKLAENLLTSPANISLYYVYCYIRDGQLESARNLYPTVKTALSVDQKALIEKLI